MPLLRPLGVGKSGADNVGLWSLLRVTAQGERPHVTRFGDILGNCSCVMKLSTPGITVTNLVSCLCEQLSCSCLGFPLRKVGSILLTSEEH